MSILSVLFKSIEIICLYWQLTKIIPTINILTTFRQGYAVEIRLLMDRRQKTFYLYILFFKILQLCVSQVLYK